MKQFIVSTYFDIYICIFRVKFNFCFSTRRFVNSVCCVNRRTICQQNDNMEQTHV